MGAQFFDTSPTSWQDLETMVALAFAEMGYESNRAHRLQTIRGTVEIDVHAIKTSTPIPTIVLCECKYWDKSVPQSVVHAFRSVCADAGAHFGLIISRKGFQSGAENSRTATNIHLMDFVRFQSTFFEEWRSGALMLLSRMRDQLLPILRAANGMQKNGLDLIDKALIDGVDPFQKYSLFFGLDGGYPQFFIHQDSFPSTFNDPTGDPRTLTKVTVSSHREYIDIATRALVECTTRFRLPNLYFDNSGALLRNNLPTPGNSEGT
jgi:hypothetical protein